MELRWQLDCDLVEIVSELTNLLRRDDATSWTAVTMAKFKVNLLIYWP